MESTMENRRRVAVVADNIVSALGLSSAENHAAVMEGRSALQRYEGLWDLPTPFAGSFLDWDAVQAVCSKEGIEGNFTPFERIVLLSVRKTLSMCRADITSERTLLILSSTKGNVDLLRQSVPGIPEDRVLLGEAAKTIAQFLGNPNRPLVVSNACISGSSAQIEAMRMIALGMYDTVVVTGADVLSPFIISGFQSLQALSAEPCRPFDEERLGINLGEAAATIVFQGQQPDEESMTGQWLLDKGAIRNDAFHVSGPSRTAEGCYRALQQVIKDEDKDSLAFINAHGTATLFNDEMEAVAIDRAGLNQVPVNGLKGYYGHTMGAAGILESIISMHAADHGIVLGTRGYNELGVSRRINLSSQHRATTKKSFVKLLSGFGGGNAALLFRKEDRQEKELL